MIINEKDKKKENLSAEASAQEDGFQNLADIFKDKLKAQGKTPHSEKIKKKTPKLSWQYLALKIIRELDIPTDKKGSVFKICKIKPTRFLETCLIDTRELCTKGEQWRYFFKVAMSSPDSKPPIKDYKKTS